MARYVLLIVGVVSILAGCNTPTCTRIELTTFEQNRCEQHYADFARASYRRSSDGLLELVMRAERPSSLDPTLCITQIMYIRTFWNVQPGTTYAEATQINGHVQYALLTPPTGVRYDGSAFVSYSIDKDGTLRGCIESGSLSPRYRMGEAVEPFGCARFCGTVVACENPREVVTTLQMLETTFAERRPASEPAR